MKASEDWKIVPFGVNSQLIQGVAELTSNTEIVIQLRLVTSGERRASAQFSVRKKEKDPVNELIALTLSDPVGSNEIRWAFTQDNAPGKDHERYTPYRIGYLPENRLTWPESIRSRLEEAVAALPKLEGKVVSIKYRFTEQGCEIYLDGRLLREVSGVQAGGIFGITLLGGAELVSITQDRIPQSERRFQKVELDHYLNASLINGSRVKTPLADTKTVGGIPFEFPKADSQGNDHIDVGRSWMYFGGLEGAFDPQFGQVSRWRGPLDVDPGRISFRLKNGNYQKLHLIAAFDGEPDELPTVTAQFYREGAGHPVQFRGEAPLFSATSSSVEKLPVALENGKEGSLYLVTIPLEPNGLSSFSDERQLVMELTKGVHVYRAYPDPTYFSEHGAGLPSGVHVYAMTLEIPKVHLEVKPDRFAHVWTSPEQPSYTLSLTNSTLEPQKVTVKLSTKSDDQTEETSERVEVEVAPSEVKEVSVPIKLTRYGIHSVKAELEHEGEVQTQTRSLAFLHPNTREQVVWEDGKGPLWGFWEWKGHHRTPGGVERLELATTLGLKAPMTPLIPHSAKFSGYNPEELAFAEKNRMQTHFLAYQLNPGKEDQVGFKFDPSKEEEMGRAIVEYIKNSPMAVETKTNKPEAVVFYAEPWLGKISAMSLPEYYGEPGVKMTPDEEAKYQKYLQEFLIAGRAVKKEWPDAKIYFPWGISSFVIPFLRDSKEATELMDGPAVDQVLFERLPEMQMGQLTFGTIFYQLKQEWIKAGKPWPPKLMSLEGGGKTSPATPGGITEDEEAERSIRGELILFAYGVNRHLGWPTLARCAGGWGEQHYGSGMAQPLPILNPKRLLGAVATLTRQLDGMNYVKMVPTGSASVFCLQFKHYKTGKLLHVVWTLRGKRPTEVSSKSAVTVYNLMDNKTVITPKDGKVPFTIGTEPNYVWGIDEDAVFALGKPDHSDAAPGKYAKVLSRFGSNDWRELNEVDADYENSNTPFIRKFLGKFSLSTEEAPANAGGKALAIQLGKQEKERKVMPYYTTLVPKQSVSIPGKASQIGLWVRASSDWGRVVYSLRDAKGERWLSVGAKDEWNADDPNCWSQFCFDGWRYITFELPGNQPWDQFRDAGSTWWGSYGGGDKVVDLPLTLEKVIIERRTDVIKGDELIPASPDDVLLGDLYAEYAAPEDQNNEVVRLSKLVMPVAKGAPALENPIKRLEETGGGARTAITKIVPPEQNYSGTACHLFFEPIEGAVHYNVWVSTYEDGRGAIRLGKNWTESGKLLTGLPSSTPLFLFVSYVDKDGKESKPSAAKRLHLENDFPFK